MRILIVSSSMNQDSRSERIARTCLEMLPEMGASANFLSLKDHILPPFGGIALQDNPTYRLLHDAVLNADGLILASPVYNWSSCAEMKKFIEHLGSTDGAVRGAFYDKVVTFVHAAGLPQSYMASTPITISMMLDFKCIINPYSVYVHDDHWDGNMLSEEARRRLGKSMAVMAELTSLLSKRTYQSNWEI